MINWLQQLLAIDFLLISSAPQIKKDDNKIARAQTPQIPLRNSFMVENVMEIIYLRVTSLAQIHKIFHWPLTPPLLLFGCQLKWMRVWDCSCVCVWVCVCVCVCVCVHSTASHCPTQSIPLHSARAHQNKQLHQAPKMRTRLSDVAGGPKKLLQTFWGRISDLVNQMILYIHSWMHQTQYTLIFTTGFSSKWSVCQLFHVALVLSAEGAIELEA